MIFNETPLKGAYVVKTEPRQDERGFFARTFCAEEFAKYNLATNMVQSNLSLSVHKYTLRGMHFQLNEAAECKLVRCITGRVLDVIIDLRKESTTFCKHFSLELSPESGELLYVPKGFAHGFLTLEENSQVFYQVSNYYSSKFERGVRWNDPAFNIKWPVSNPIISLKDSQHLDFDPIKGIQ